MRTKNDAVKTLIETLLHAPGLRVGLRELRDGGIVFVADSPASAALIGRSPDALRGKTAAELGIPAAVAEQCRVRAARAIASGEASTFVGELPVRGRVVQVRSTIVPLPDASRCFLQFLTEQTAGNTQVAALHHELATPLMTVHSLVELLGAAGSRTDVPEEVANVIDDLRVATQRATEVLHTMRTLTAATVETRASLAALVVEAVGVATQEAAVPRDRIETGHIEDVEVVTGRSAALQILVNVVRNALQAVASVPPRRGAAVRIKTRVTAEVAIVEVEDDGTGVADDVMQQLFQPFATGRPGGNGVGLYVSRMLAERIGATIELVNRADAAGARATVTLRRARAAT